MRLVRHFDEVPSELRGGVIALGNFDGLHLGHQAVIGEAKRIAEKEKVSAGLMTFEPHPRLFFQPDLEPFRLSPFRIKVRLIETLNVDLLYVQKFDSEFSQRSAENFIEEILMGGLGATHVVVGDDYVFGRGRSGNAEVLAKHASRLGFKVTSVPELAGQGGARYSSTTIRDRLADGRCEDAARLLGRYWEIEGRVEHGDQRGRFMGFPTANLPHRDYLHPKKGVYAVRTGIDQSGQTIWQNGIANFGHRPTFDKKDVILETHVFDYEEDLYNRHLRVALIEHIRPEMKFDNVDAIKAQIATDCGTAREILERYDFPAAAPFVPVVLSS